MDMKKTLLALSLFGSVAAVSAAELTTFQAGQVASAAEVNGNFQRLAAEQAALQARVEQAIADGNASLDALAADGLALAEQVRSELTQTANEAVAAADAEFTALESADAALQAQVSSLLAELDRVNARLAALEAAGGGSSDTPTSATFSPVGSWVYMLHETGMGFDPSPGQDSYHEIFGEAGFVDVNADGTLSQPRLADGLGGGLATFIGRNSDGSVNIRGSRDNGGDQTIVTPEPISATWSTVSDGSGAVFAITFNNEDGDGRDGSIRFFKGGEDHLQTILIDNDDGWDSTGDGAGAVITSITLIRIGD